MIVNTLGQLRRVVLYLALVVIQRELGFGGIRSWFNGLWLLETYQQEAYGVVGTFLHIFSSVVVAAPMVGFDEPPLHGSPEDVSRGQISVR